MIKKKIFCVFSEWFGNDDTGALHLQVLYSGTNLHRAAALSSSTVAKKV